jgi:hypothetical protein
VNVLPQHRHSFPLEAEGDDFEAEEEDFDLMVVNMFTIIFWFNTNPKIIATDKISEFVFLLSSMSINTIPTAKVTPIINNNLINDKMLKLLALT